MSLKIHYLIRTLWIEYMYNKTDEVNGRGGGGHYPDNDFYKDLVQLLTRPKKNFVKAPLHPFFSQGKKNKNVVRKWFCIETCYGLSSLHTHTDSLSTLTTGTNYVEFEPGRAKRRQNMVWIKIFQKGMLWPWPKTKTCQKHCTPFIKHTLWAKCKLYWTKGTKKWCQTDRSIIIRRPQIRSLNQQFITCWCRHDSTFGVWWKICCFGNFYKILALRLSHPKFSFSFLLCPCSSCSIQPGKPLSALTALSMAMKYASIRSILEVIASMDCFHLQYVTLWIWILFTSAQ